MSLIDNIKSFSEKEQLGAKKSKLLQAFLAKGFPTIKEEDWKYTSLKKIVSDDFSVEGNGATISENDIKKYTLGFESKIIFLGGVLISKPNIKGVSISGFSDFPTKNKDAISGLNKINNQSKVAMINNCGVYYIEINQSNNIYENIIESKIKYIKWK